MSISDQETSEDEGMGINYFWVLKIILKTSDELMMGLVTFTYITKWRHESVQDPKKEEKKTTYLDTCKPLFEFNNL